MKSAPYSHVVFLVALLIAAVGCSDADSSHTADAGGPDSQPTDVAVDHCSDWCDHMRDCGLIGVDQQECLDACDAALDDGFLDACTTCLEQTSCQATRDDCFAPGQACHRQPTTSYMATVGGLSDDSAGARGVGRLITYDGVDLGAFAEATVTEGNLQLSFGTVLSPGLHYLMQYYVDLDDDGACDPAVDEAYEHEVFIDEDSVVVYGVPNVPDTPSPELCDVFTSTDDLCQRRCERLDDCGSLTTPLATCQSDCVDEASPAFLNRCVGCLEEFDCSSHADACQQTGGVCDADHIEPETEFLLGGTHFGDYEGLPVYAQVEDLAGQILTPLLEDTIEDGGFFFHFGKTVWMNQTYVAVFFVDADENGRCDPSEPGWAIEIEVEESTLHYEIHDHDDADVTDVCARIQGG